MKKRNLEFNNQLERTKVKQKVKYKYFDIPKDIFDKTFDEATKKYDDEDEIKKEHDRLIQKYIINHIDEEYMFNNIINNFSAIKIIIVKNKKYDLPAPIIDNVYKKAIKLLKYVYDKNESLQMNTLINMKYIINNNYIDTPINKMDIQIYDIVFLKKYIIDMKIDQNKFANEIGISNNELISLLKGEKKATIDEMESILIYFDVETIDELKEKGEKEIMKKKINIDEIKEQLKEEPKREKHIPYRMKNNEKYYNLSFMKEYVELYKIRKDYLSQLFSCGLKKVDEILNGTIWIKESLMSDVYIEYRVSGFVEFKAKILGCIRVYKLNDLKNRLRVFSDKYRNLKIKEESLIDLMPKDLLVDALELDKMPEIDRKITKLLFKIGFNDEYTYDDIAMILEVDRQRVIKLYKDNLKKVIDLLKESQNNIYILKQ